MDAKSNNPLSLPVAIIVAAIIIAGAIFLVWRSPGAGQQTRTGGTADTLQPEIKTDLAGWPALGNPQAPVTIVEYADYACPFCGRFWQDTFPLITENYIATGKVRFVYKDFVVVGGDRAAEAAHCADEQGKFWEYHDLLYENQAEDRGQWGSAEIHRQYGAKLGLNVQRLISCFEERKYQEKVIQSSQEAAGNGAQGTPFFLVNGEVIAGAHPYTTFQQVIEQALSKN